MIARSDCGNTCRSKVGACSPIPWDDKTKLSSNLPREQCQRQRPTACRTAGVCDLGVLFVHGIGTQKRGATLAAFGGPVFDWLVQRFAGHDLKWRDALSDHPELAKRLPLDPQKIQQLTIQLLEWRGHLRLGNRWLCRRATKGAVIRRTRRGRAYAQDRQREGVGHDGRPCRAR